MEEISDKTRNGEEISYKTRNRISPETVPRELAQHLWEESVSFLAEDGEKSFEREIHTMIKRSNEYATWKKYAEEKDLEIYLPETKAKERGDVRVVIFWSFYPKRTDDRQPCQEEVERVIYLFLTQCNTFSHEEAVEYIKNILWVNRMPYILPWDADTGKNKKTYEEMLSITDYPTKIITLQLMGLLPNVEKVLILGGRAWDFFGVMIPDLVSQAGPITHPMNWFMGRVREKQQERAMTNIPGIISGSTIPSRDTWNQYIKVTANMTETAIILRRKKQHHQKVINHFAMKLMREMLCSKDDLSEEMIENMGMEEMISNLEEDYKTETLEKQRASNRKRNAARLAAMTEEEREEERASKRKNKTARYAAMTEEEREEERASKRKKNTARYAAMTEEERASNRKKDATRYAAMTDEERASKRKREAARYAATTEEERASNRKKDTARYAAKTDEERASKRKREAARYAAKTEEEKENTKQRRRKKSAEKTAEEKENINTQRRKMRKKSAEKTAEEKENINTQRRKKLAEKTVTDEERASKRKREAAR
jgi:hypothetical protein